jgi:hypothetical protein
MDEFRALPRAEKIDKLLQPEKLSYLASASAALGIPPSEAEHPPELSPGTLGAVLYAGNSTIPVSEELGRACPIHRPRQSGRAARAVRTDETACLYVDRAHHWRAAIRRGVDAGRFLRRLAACAHRYDPREGTVLARIMNRARAKAIDRPRVDPVFERTDTHAPFDTEPADLLEPSQSLQERLARYISTDMGWKPKLPATPQWREPEWEVVAPGISCKLLARDTAKHRISMLVRLVAGGEYPPHTHAGVEELHLLHGELWIDDRKLYPGDYNRAEPGTGDKRVWSETGCTCVLITSTQDILN